MTFIARELTLRGFHLAVVGAVIAALVAALAVQTVRVEGLKLWPIEVEGWKPRATRLEQTLANVRVAEQLAEAWARQARIDLEARYRAVAERTDIDAREATSVALGDAERFIAAGGHAAVRAGADRLRAETDRGSGGPAAAGTGDQGTGDPQGAGAPAELDEAGRAFVAVTADDVRICTVNTVKAEAARHWALELEHESAPAATAD